MSSWHRAGAIAGLAVLAGAALAQGTSERFPGIGRAATPKEVAAWDIDVRPDFKGLPPGSGSVARGQVVWENQCASCHGYFGESVDVFTPLIGGTTAADVKSGRVARLTDGGFPGRTTMMKLSTVSTLWDYIHRAMPWNSPKSLAVDDVYAVTAYFLHMGGVLADDFVLSDKNIGDVQARLPNREGKTTDHAMWPGSAFGSRPPDVRATACMKNCGSEPVVASSLPAYALDAHGNLAQQNRLVGPQRGIDMARARDAAPPTPTALGALSAPALAQKHNCMVCHGVERKLVGPAFRDVAAKHGGRADAVNYLAGKIKAGGAGVWGSVPMPEQTLPGEDARLIAQWLVDGARP